MTYQETSKIITEIIAKTVNCDSSSLTPETVLVDLGVDSLKALTILFKIEDALDIEIPNEIIPSIVTLNDILKRLPETAA